MAQLIRVQICPSVRRDLWILAQLIKPSIDDKSAMTTGMRKSNNTGTRYYLVDSRLPLPASLLSGMTKRQNRKRAAMPNSTDSCFSKAQPNLLRGARNAVQICLGVQAEDRVVLICDEATAVVASALMAAIDETGATKSVFLLERWVERPAQELPPALWTAHRQATVCIYAVQPQATEHVHRLALVSAVAPLKLRHAHMVRITPDALMQGMLADYRRIARLNELMIERLSRTTLVRVRSAKGTDVTVRLDPNETWDSAAGIIRPGQWYNLPNGEITTCPGAVDGVFVCDAIAPSDTPVDAFDLARRPLQIELADGMLVQVSGGPPGLAEQVGALAAGDSAMNRIGMFGMGTNFELLMPIGDPAQDLFLPGGYFALGRLATPSSPRATWSSRNLLPFAGRRTTVELDGMPLIHDGRFAQSLLDMTERVD